MHAVFHHLLLATSTKKQGSSLAPLIMIALFGVVWYFFIRPRRKAMRNQQLQAKTFSVGDEIMTIGGVIGVVVDFQSDRFTIRTGGAEHGTELVFTKAAFKSMAPAIPEATVASDAPEGDAAAGDVEGGQ
jgi:preprotein translocase subunit YajC